MKKLSLPELLLGLVLATIGDVGSGILATVVVSAGFGVPALSLQFLLSVPWTVFWAWAPDGDVAIGMARGMKVDSEHRALFHRPLPIFVAIAILIVLAALFFQPAVYWLVLTTVGLLAHFAHDSLGDTNWWGVPWLDPLLPHFFLLVFKRSADGSFFFGFDAYSPEKMATFRPRPLDEWLRGWYLRLTPESVGGVVWFLFSLVSVIVFILR